MISGTEMKHRILAIIVLLAAAVPNAPGAIRVIRFSESIPFTMGEVTSRRIVHPGLGAKKTTLNFSISKPGNEFAQHVHDYSDDTILVLAGEVHLRQGPSLHLFKAGETAFVPTGQIHGTVTAGTGEAIMISFQNPPDLILYTGARDSKKTGEAPKGVITEGAVKYLNFASKNGRFTSPAMGSMRAAGAYRRLKTGQSFKSKIAPDGEGFFFVWKGSIEVRDSHGKTYQAGERDTVFIQGAANLTVVGTADGTELIQVEAPPSNK